jgi:formate hydrogenlyase transcriptional activator
MKIEDEYETSFPEEKKLLLCLAALFESDFSLDWLEELTGMKASRILSVLEEEVQHGLLIRKKPAVYFFKNNAQREGWLRRLDHAERERYHRRMADLLIRELPDDNCKALEIAQHLLHGSNDWKECQWLVRAGEIYAGLFNAPKAIACFEKVLNELSGQRGDNEDWLFIKAAIEHSNIFAARSDTEASLSFLKEARERARRLHKKSYELLLEMHIAKYERLGSEFNNALGRFEKAFSQVEQMDDPELTSASAMFNTYFLFWQGRFRDVIEVYERSVPDVEKYPVGHFPIIAAMMVGHCYTMVGQFTQGLGMLDAIRDYCLKKGDRYLSSHSGSVIAMAMLSVNRLEDALHYLKLTLKEADESGNYRVGVIATLVLAHVHYLMDNKKESLQHLRRFLKNSKGMQTNMLLYPYLMEICWAMERGEVPSMQGLSLEHEIDRMLKLKNIFMKGIAYRYQALLGKSKSWPNQKIARLLTLSVKWLKDSGYQIELAKTQLELARYYVSARNEKKAKATIRMASGIFSSMNTEMVPDDLRALAGNEKLERTIFDEMINLVTEMASREDNRKLLQQIVATANRIIGAERGALLLLDEDNQYERLHLRASKNLTIEQIYDPGFVSSIKMIEEVIAAGVGHISETNPIGEAVPASKEAVYSSICVPVILHEKIIGALYHENRLLCNVFKESDLKLLAYFAALAAIDLDSARTHQNENEKEEKLLIEQKDAQPYHVEGIIGTSPAMQQILTQIGQIARTDTAVLILGETGVGKNIVAGAIHRQSLRRDNPFIIVQCSALTESLITSELFGHEKGAFTGATNRRIGRFELAHGGTLFLDEIGDLSLEVQARLLRVLQSKEFERVGGGKDILTSDFRLIAATNRDLEKEVKEKKFREDLYYRINIFPLCIPSLRERREDIPLLAHHFFTLFTARYGKSFDKIPQEVMERLVRHHWPGNIRELENIIQRSVISSQGPKFHLSPLEIPQPRGGQADTFSTLEENERRHILEALERSGWKIHGAEGAADILKIHPSTLSSRMKKLGIRKQPKRSTGRLTDS